VITRMGFDALWQQGGLCCSRGELRRGNHAQPGLLPRLVKRWNGVFMLEAEGNSKRLAAAFGEAIELQPEVGGRLYDSGSRAPELGNSEGFCRRGKPRRNGNGQNKRPAIGRTLCKKFRAQGVTRELEGAFRNLAPR